MHRRFRMQAWLRRTGAAVLLAAGALNAQAQSAPAATESFSLKQAFDAAWGRQPEALALAARRDAARAQSQAAQSWTPEPAALEWTNKTDRLSGNRGVREFQVGVAWPLWLPGERAHSATLAQAEGGAVEARAAAAQLRVAASVREAWWQWQRARIDDDIARDQLDNTRRIAADVARRLKAGDLARADQHQADGAVAAAQSGVAQAQAAMATALQQLRGSTGVSVAAAGAADTTAEPDLDAPTTGTDGHAALLELTARAAVAESAVALAAAQSRANPELLLAATRDRGNFGDAYQHSLSVGLRIPFGSGARHDARSASARADALEAQAQLALERDQLVAARDATRTRVTAARDQLAAADRRAELARESRSFFDKSFRLGETDLPTRLRIEAEAADAQRQAARTRIELAAAISAWRQALGLLPQ